MKKVEDTDTTAIRYYTLQFGTLAAPHSKNAYLLTSNQG